MCIYIHIYISASYILYIYIQTHRHTHTHILSPALPGEFSTTEPPGANAGDVRDTGLTPGLRQYPGLGRSPGGEHSHTLQYLHLENPMDRGTWCSSEEPRVHRVSRSQTGLK